MNYRISQEPHVDHKPDPRIDTLSGKGIFCRNCARFITEREEFIEIEGSVFHYKKNPAGIFFTIACFKNAPGAKQFNDYTRDYTWFSGYKWSIAICSECSIHLGWHYSGSGDFYGLIADRLLGL